jgi:hypothetical protein
MLKVRLVVASLGLAMILPILPALQAQTADAPAAPLPSQIVTAKRVFISNAGGELYPGFWSGGPSRTYNEFYAATKSWGRYELVAAPVDADLVLQISYADPIMLVASGSSVNFLQFRLELIDPKTHIVLWTINEQAKAMGGLQKSRDKEFEGALNKLVDDLKALTAQPTAAAK